jgi:hypothetical protein
MLRIAVLATLITSVAAHASDERIAVVGTDPALEQLRESVCISEQCVFSAARPDWTRAAKEKLVAVVTARQVRNQLEISVHEADGDVRFTRSAPLNDAGRLSVTDLMTASAAVVHAIEFPAEAKAKASAEPVSPRKAKPTRKVATRKAKPPARG